MKQEFEGRITVLMLASEKKHDTELALNIKMALVGIKYIPSSTKPRERSCVSSKNTHITS